MFLEIDHPEELESFDEAQNVNESRHDRFLRVAERRVNKILSDLDLLQNCSVPSNYEYTDEEVEKLLVAISDKLDETRYLFMRGKKKKNRFTF